MNVSKGDGQLSNGRCLDSLDLTPKERQTRTVFSVVNRKIQPSIFLLTELIAKSTFPSLFASMFPPTISNLTIPLVVESASVAVTVITTLLISVVSNIVVKYVDGLKIGLLSLTSLTLIVTMQIDDLAELHLSDTVMVNLYRFCVSKSSLFAAVMTPDF